MSDDERMVLYEPEGRIAYITFNRTEILNALSGPALLQLDEALDTNAARLLLDNFTPDMLKEAVRRRDAHGSMPRKQLEASGNINIGNVRQYAETGVDMISVGSLTKNVASIDFSMLFD